MKRSLASLLLILMLNSAQAQLSAEAQRDLLLMQMAEAAMALEHAHFLDLLSNYEAAGGVVEPEMRYYQALALAELVDVDERGDALRARDTVVEFINNAEANHPLYRQALELYSRVQPEAEALERARLAEAEALRLRQERRANLLQMAPLYAALENGQRLLRSERFSSPSPWDDGSSPQDFRILSPSLTDWATVHRAEVHQGLLPLPDGGWLAYGQRPAPGPAPETRRNRHRAEILSGRHAPQTTFYPQASVLRFDADGHLQSSRYIDWRQVYAKMLQATQPVRQNRMGVFVIPANDGLRVIDISPIRVRTETPLQVGDVITHIERRRVTPTHSVESHLENFRRNRPPRFRVQRNGERLELDVPFPVRMNLEETSVGRIAGWPWRVPDYLMHAVGLRHDTVQLTHPEKGDWSSEIVAVVPGNGDSFTLCANIDAGVVTDDRGRVQPGSVQVGVLLRGRFDDHASAGVELESIATITHDHPGSIGRYMWWYDNALMDCVGLPDGGLLTVSRSVPLMPTPRGNPSREANPQHVFSRILRTYDSHGRYTGGQSFTDERPRRNPDRSQGENLRPTAYAVHQPHFRFQPSAESEGWNWYWGDRLFQARNMGADSWGYPSHSIQLQLRDFSSPLAVVNSPQDTDTHDGIHELVLKGNTRVPLLPGHAADRLQLKRVLERSDGTYLVLLAVQYSDISLGQPVPGGVLGDYNGPNVRAFFFAHPADWLFGRYMENIQHLAGQEDFLLELSADGELLWSKRLVPEQAAETRISTGSLSGGELSLVVMQEWTNLAVLADDSILVTMKKGDGLRIFGPDLEKVH